jgi:hypothetical protein
LRNHQRDGGSGTRDVYLVGSSGTINLDWIRFTNSPTARYAAADEPAGTPRH